MAEGFHSQRAIEMDEEIKTAVKEMVNSKLQSINEFISKLDEKLDVKFTKMIETIRLMAGVQFQAEPNSNLTPNTAEALAIHEPLDIFLSEQHAIDDFEPEPELESAVANQFKAKPVYGATDVLNWCSKDEGADVKLMVDASEIFFEEFVQFEVTTKPVSLNFSSSLLSCMDNLDENEIQVSNSEVLRSADGVCLPTVRQNDYEKLTLFLPPDKPPDEFLTVDNEMDSKFQLLVDVYYGRCYYTNQNLALSSIQWNKLADWPSSKNHQPRRYVTFHRKDILALFSNIEPPDDFMNPVQKIVYEMSEGSKYFEHEERKEALMKQRVENMCVLCSSLTPSDLFRFQRVAEEKIVMLEATHDLTRIWFHVDMDAFYAAVETLSNLSLKAEIVDELRVRINEETCLTCSAGVAPNRLLTSVCTDINKPNGQFFLPNDRIGVMTFISSLPLRKVGGIGMVTENILKDVFRINTCEQLLQWVTKPPPRPPDFWLSQLVLKWYDAGGVAGVFGQNLGHGIDSSYDARQFGGAFGGATGINFGGSHVFGNGVNQDFVESYGTGDVAGPNMMVDPYSVNGGVIYTVNCDMVLGILCLTTLGTILWNIEHFTMKFKVNQRKLISKLVTQNTHLAMICVTNIEATDELSFFEYPESQPPLPIDIEVVFMITTEDEELMVDVSEGFTNEDVLLARNVQLAMLCIDGVADNEQCNIKPRFFEHTPITSDIDIVLTEFERVSIDPTMLHVLEQWPLIDLLKKGADKERQHHGILILFFSLPRQPENRYIRTLRSRFFGRGRFDTGKWHPRARHVTGRD